MPWQLALAPGYYLMVMQTLIIDYAGVQTQQGCVEVVCHACRVKQPSLGDGSAASGMARKIAAAVLLLALTVNAQYTNYGPTTAVSSTHPSSFPYALDAIAHVIHHATGCMLEQVISIAQDHHIQCHALQASNDEAGNAARMERCAPLSRCLQQTLSVAFCTVTGLGAHRGLLRHWHIPDRLRLRRRDSQ